MFVIYNHRRLRVLAAIGPDLLLLEEATEMVLRVPGTACTAEAPTPAAVAAARAALEAVATPEEVADAADRAAAYLDAAPASDAATVRLRALCGAMGVA